MRRLAFPLVLLVLIGSGWAWEGHGRHAHERQLGAVATQLAGRPVGVRCQSLWRDLLSIRSDLGEVRTDASGRLADETDLRRTTCQRLGTLVDDRLAQLDCLVSVDWSRPDRADPCIVRVGRLAHLVGTLAHESMHLRGYLDEAVAQCYAVQSEALAAVLLGGSRELGEALARFELFVTGGMPSEYQSFQCRPGGTLDLHPETPEFPTEAALAPPSGFGPALR